MVEEMKTKMKIGVMALAVAVAVRLGADDGDLELLERAKDLFPTNWLQLSPDRRTQEEYNAFQRDYINRKGGPGRDIINDYLVGIVTSTVVTVSTNAVNDGVHAGYLWGWDFKLRNAVCGSKSFWTNQTVCMAFARYATTIHTVEFPDILTRMRGMRGPSFRARYEAEESLQWRVRLANDQVSRFRLYLCNLCNNIVRACKYRIPREEFESFTNRLNHVEGLTPEDKRQIFDL